MASYTRKHYLELFLDGIPVVASGRNSNRHTSLVEAGEHAEEYAREINAPGDYEVRVDGGLYYMIRITDIVFDPTVPVPTPPNPEAELALDAVSYFGNENSTMAFTIVRTGDLNSVVDVDWAITNANATPAIGTERFQIGIALILVTVNTGEVGPTEIGDVTLSNVVTISGAVNNTLGAQFTATFTIIDLDVANQDLIHNDHPWDHSSEPLGVAQEIDGIWNQSTGGSIPPSDWRIVDTNLMIPGTKQFRTKLVKQGASQERVERSEGREPRTTLVVSVGGGHWQAPQKLWYGFLLRIDAAVAFNKGHWVQWHGNSSLGGGLSPFISLTGRQSPEDGLEIRIEAEEDGGVTFHSGTLPELTRANIIGITHAYIFEILWDSRDAGIGGQGIIRLYLDDNPVPIFERLNTQNCVAGDLEHRSGNGVFNVPYLKYGLYKSNLKTTGVDGDTYIQNYQNYAVHGENATWQGVLDSLLWNQVTG